MATQIRKDLEALLLSEKERGFFTAFYVAAGRLDETEPRYSFGDGQSLFDLASLTKALVTGPLVHSFLELNGLTRSNALSSWPGDLWQSAFSSELMNLSADALLSHRSGLPAWRNFWMGYLNEGPYPKASLKNPIITDTFARLNGLGPPDDVYSDLGYILLGYALEAASGITLDQLWETHLKKISFSPSLSSKALGFSTQIDKSGEVIPSAFCALRNRLLRAEVHDENCAALGGIAGHAGLFGSGSALAHYLRSLFHSPEGLRYFQSNESCLPQHQFEGLSGLRRGNGTSAALFADGKGMGHLGFTGTAFWLDLPSRRFVIFLSNRVISGRVNPHMTAVRRQVFGLLNECA